MGTCTRMRTRSVILTSASLVRSADDGDEIDKNLRVGVPNLLPVWSFKLVHDVMLTGLTVQLQIEVFLPPNQRAYGRLELYHLNYNIAIISVEKSFLAARPENIFYTVEKPSKNVVAIGREAAEGLLLATFGEVTDMPNMYPSELDCGDLKLSTCKIKKVGIGGPLINSDDGSLVGLNFYDDTDETPFLPRSKIVDVLKGIDLPSQSGLNSPVNMMNDSTVKKNRWLVPEAYWYHPLLDKDWDPIPRHVGRVLQ
ncbi:uncharacterized protein LOC119284168 [Triticum dicoccoides]|uniref:uncharacterized protein LOC119284168 n=1 Tax=Triticum dicoccoides TaxID=85692 RepID=UPI00188E4CEB|nr:uncharacterized protein LOC119284168 [Triticum dicoccoides]